LLIFNSTIPSSYAIYCNRNTLEFIVTASSDVVKDSGHEAKARTKDLGHEAKAKTKDLGHEAKARTKDLGHEAKAKTKDLVTRSRPRPRTWVPRPRILVPISSSQDLNTKANDSYGIF